MSVKGSDDRNVGIFLTQAWRLKQHEDITVVAVDGNHMPRTRRRVFGFLSGVGDCFQKSMGKLALSGGWVEWLCRVGTHGFGKGKQRILVVQGRRTDSRL